MSRARNFSLQLDSMSDEEIMDQIDAASRNTGPGLGFWVDELANRRARRRLEAIASSGQATAERLDRLAKLTAVQAEQNDRAERINLRMYYLTAANSAIAALALVAAVVAIVAER